ncbi:MAG: hypothetical protein NXI01_04575 [Gammaproteobacteria bacterium]|nr:hypothetical protein [Gammaproteobacteria bacterium]
MKKILLIGLIFCSTGIWASPDQVNIKIANDSGKDCLLEKQTILYGHVSDYTSIPDAIYHDQSIKFSLRSEPYRLGFHKDKWIVLTYACGNQSITLFTRIEQFQGMYFSHSKVFDVEHDLHATFKETRNNSGRAYDQSPIEIQWTLTQ